MDLSSISGTTFPEGKVVVVAENSAHHSGFMEIGMMRLKSGRWAFFSKSEHDSDYEANQVVKTWCLEGVIDNPWGLSIHYESHSYLSIFGEVGTVWETPTEEESQEIEAIEASM